MSSNDQTGPEGGHEAGHDSFQLLLGAYVLGGLDPADRERVDRHLPRCAACRDELSRTAAIPGLLSRLPATARPGAGPAPAPSAALLPQLLAQVAGRRTARRVRPRSLLAVAAAVIVALLAGGLGGLTLNRQTPSEPPASTVTLLAAAGGSSAGQAELSNRPWGTAMTLRLNDLPSPGPFTLEVLGSDGQRERAATWGATPNTRIEVTGATSLTTADISRLRVLGPAGEVLTGST